MANQDPYVTEPSALRAYQVERRNKFPVMFMPRPWAILRAVPVMRLCTQLGAIRAEMFDNWEHLPSECTGNYPN